MGYKGKSSEAPCVKAARLYLACDVRTRTSQGIPGPRGMTRRVTLQERFIFLVTPLNRLMDFVVDTASLSMRLA